MSDDATPDRNRTQAVIFDLDGVLVVSIPLHFEAYRRTFATQGVDFTFDDYMRLGSGASREVLIRRVVEDVSETKLEELMALKEHHVRECVAERGVEPVRGAREFVERVRDRGLAVAVATVGRTPGIFLEGAGLRDLFDTIIDRNHVAEPKPDPEVYLKAAEAIRVPPARCLVIEDTPRGIEAAVAAGMRVLALATSEPAERLSRARAVFPDFTTIDLDRWLE